MIISRYLLIAFILIATSMSAYVEKLVGLRHPTTGKICFVCFDNHEQGSTAENTEQADFFIDTIIAQCKKKLESSNEKLGIFFESVYFYNFFARNKINIIALQLDQKVLYKTFPNRQTTWIHWQLPNRLIEKLRSDAAWGSNIIVQSVDPRLPIIGLRNTLLAQDISLPVKSYALADLNAVIFDVGEKMIQTLLELSVYSSYDQEDFSKIIRLTSEISKKLIEQRENLSRLINEYFKDKSIGKSISSNSLFKELRDNELHDFLTDIAIVPQISTELEEYLLSDKLFSEALDLVAFMDIMRPSSPKYSLVFVGSAHAQNIVSYLKSIGYRELPNFSQPCENVALQATSSNGVAISPASDCNIEYQAEQIPTYFSSSKSKSLPNLFDFEDV